MMRIPLRLSLFASIVFVAGLSSCKKEIPAPPLVTGLVATALPPKPVPAFDAERALRIVDTQVNFGPRVPNSAGHDQEVEWLYSSLQQCTPNVQRQAFTQSGYDAGEELALTNIIASFNPSATWRILIVTHFDSRPFADESPADSSKKQAVPAANDGGSGTAVMLELARVMKDNPPPIGVDLLFDDGEDYGNYKIDDLTHYFLGVKYFVKAKASDYNPRYAILLDMVGDKKALFQPEGHSLQSAPQLVTEIWKTAESLGLSHFKSTPGPTIEDDHLPLIDAGIPSVDLIDGDLVGHASPDADRKYWHTLDDLPYHLSSQTLGEVGRLLLTLFYDRLPRDIPTL
ncbi:MAG: M28 family peptidase [Bacteroidota bacterium]|nr:M28 family peptidase [Bacteroidota bacterium]MDP4232194.1 M28 family peptidase [Bacteroidota bacterium]MDP4243625.1 M28 family peptidase [Bacteroidota bacterium]MDP4288721.1 M28 family peptidase [Bacteroidota bacterium]